MSRCCSISHPTHLVLWRWPCWSKPLQCPLPSEVLWFTPTALIFLERCSPLAKTFTAEVPQQLSTSPHLPRLQGSPSKASPARHAFSFRGITWTHQAFGPPQSYSAVEDQATIQTYQRKWDTWKSMILPQTISSILNPLAKYMCVYIHKYIYIYITHILRNKRQRSD